MASPLPIHHQWCIADKLLGSNKPLLRGWPHWWKQKLPHGHPSIHSPVFSIQQSVLVSVQGNSYQHYYFSGVVCARVRWQKRTNTQFVFRLGVASPPLFYASAGRWSRKGYSHSTRLTCVFTRLFKQHQVSFRVDIDKWTGAEHTFLGVLMQIFGSDAQRCLHFCLSFFLRKDQHRKGFVLWDQHHQGHINPDQFIRLVY